MPTTRLVLLPGMDGTGLLFEPLVELLPSDWEATVVRYPATEPRGYETLLGLVQRALPKTGRFIVLGESFSGPLAILAAQAWPDRVQGVVLCASFVTCPRPSIGRLLDLIVTPATLAMVPRRVGERALIGAHGTPRLRSLIDRALTLVPADVIVSRIKATQSVDVSAALRSCPAPVLYLRAEHDWLVPASCARQVAQCKPDAHFVTIAAPHLLLQTKPAEAIRAIREFVAHEL